MVCERLSKVLSQTLTGKKHHYIRSGNPTRDESRVNTYRQTRVVEGVWLLGCN